jgi:hypothetical protein
MAGKSRRVASRQGELSRRRKRAQRGPSGIPASPARPQPQENGGAVLAVETAASGASPAVAQQAPPAPTPAAAERPVPQSRAGENRGQRRTRGERPAAYNYVGAELRRIGILSTVVLAALIAISVVL